MRKTIFILATSALALFSFNALAERYACQIADNGPCLTGDFSEAINYTTKNGNYSDCADINKILSNNNACMVYGQKTILFKTTKTFGVSNLDNIGCEKDSLGNTLKGSDKAKCLNEQTGNNNDPKTIDKSSTINSSVIIAGYNTLFKRDGDNWCLGSAEDHNCNKGLDNQDALAILFNSPIARKNPEDRITIFQGDMSDENACSDKLNAPCGSYSTINIDTGTDPAFNIPSGGHLILRNLLINVSSGYLAKIGANASLVLRNVVISNSSAKTTIVVDSKGSVSFTDFFDIQHLFNQPGAFGVKFLGTIPTEGFIKIAGSLSEQIIQNGITSYATPIFFKLSTSFDPYYETDASKNWSLDANAPSGTATTYGSYFVRRATETQKLISMDKNVTCNFDNQNQIKCANGNDSLTIADTDRCMRIYSSQDTKTTYVAFNAYADIKKISEVDLITSQIACKDSTLTFKCASGSVLIKDDSNNYTCQPLNGWKYDPQTFKKSCDSPSVQLADGSCLANGCPYGSTYNPDPAHKSCDCKSGTEKVPTLTNIYASIPLPPTGAFICVQKCGTQQINGIKKHLNDTYPEQSAKDAFVEIAYAWGQVTTCPTNDCFVGPIPLASMDKCVDDVSAMNDTCSTKDLTNRTWDKTKGTCHCNADYSDIGVADGTCQPVPACDGTTATLDSTHNVCKCIDTTNASPNTGGLSCSCNSGSGKTMSSSGTCKAPVAVACYVDADCGDSTKMCQSNQCVAKTVATTCTGEGQILTSNNTCLCDTSNNYQPSEDSSGNAVTDSNGNPVCTKDIKCSGTEIVQNGVCVPDPSINARLTQGGCASSIGAADTPTSAGAVLPYIILLIASKLGGIARRRRI